MKAGRRAGEFLVDIAGVTHKFADTVWEIADHIRERAQIQKASLGDAIEPFGRFERAAPVSEAGQQKGS